MALRTLNYRALQTKINTALWRRSQFICLKKTLYVPAKEKGGAILKNITNDKILESPCFIERINHNIR